MKAVCSECGARYHVPEEQVKSKGLRIKCRKCDNVFSVSSMDVNNVDAEDVMSQSRRATGAHRAVAEASTDEAQWHYAVNGEHFGPYTEDEMITRFSNGELTDETFIWRKGFTRWKPATAERAFARALAGKGAAPEQPAHTLTPSDVQATEGSGRLTIEVRRPGATISDSAASRGALVTDDVDDAFDSLFGSSKESDKAAAPKPAARPTPAARPATAKPATARPAPSAKPGAGKPSSARPTPAARPATAKPATARPAPSAKPGAATASGSGSHLKTTDSLAERLRKLREAREQGSSPAPTAGAASSAPTPGTPTPAAEPAADKSEASAQSDTASSPEETQNATAPDAAANDDARASSAHEAAPAAAPPAQDSVDTAGPEAPTGSQALYDDDEKTSVFEDEDKPLYDDDEDTAIYSDSEVTPTTVVANPESHARKQEAALSHSLHDEFAARDSERRRVEMSRASLADYDPTQDADRFSEAPPYVLPDEPAMQDDNDEPLPAVMIAQQRNRRRIAILLGLLLVLALVMVALLMMNGRQSEDSNTAGSEEQNVQVDDESAAAEQARMMAIQRQNEGLARSRALRTIGSALSDAERDSYRRAQALQGQPERSAGTRTARTARPANQGSGDSNTNAASMGFVLDQGRAPQVNVGAREEESTGPSASHFQSTMNGPVQASINRCTQRHRAVNGSLNFARVELQVSVNPNGSVEGLTVQRGIRDTAFANCLVSESSRWSFQPFEGSVQRIGRAFIVR